MIPLYLLRSIISSLRVFFCNNWYASLLSLFLLSRLLTWSKASLLLLTVFLILFWMDVSCLSMANIDFFNSGSMNLSSLFLVLLAMLWDFPSTVFDASKFYTVVKVSSLLHVMMSEYKWLTYANWLVLPPSFPVCTCLKTAWKFFLHKFGLLED